MFQLRFREVLVIFKFFKIKPQFFIKRKLAFNEKQSSIFKVVFHKLNL